MLQGQGGADIATDSRDTGRCLSLYVCLRGRLEHVYSNTDWGAVVETKAGTSDTNHTGEALSSEAC